MRFSLFFSLDIFINLKRVKYTVCPKKQPKCEKSLENNNLFLISHSGINLSYDPLWVS